MTKKEQIAWLEQIEKDIYVCSLESTFSDEAKSCAIHKTIEELKLRQEPCVNKSTKSTISQGFSQEDCISRQAVLDILGRFDRAELIRRVVNMPSVEPVREHGKWIKHTYEDGGYNYECDNCHEYSCFTGNNDDCFCPHCGADMREEKNDQ